MRAVSPHAWRCPLDVFSLARRCRTKWAVCRYMARRSGLARLQRRLGQHLHRGEWKRRVWILVIRAVPVNAGRWANTQPISRRQVCPRGSSAHERAEIVMVRPLRTPPRSFFLGVGPLWGEGIRTVGRLDPRRRERLQVQRPKSNWDDLRRSLSFSRATLLGRDNNSSRGQKVCTLQRSHA